MVSTIKFSEFDDGGDLANDDITVGYGGGTNIHWNNPWTFLPPGTTGDRPVPSADMYYRLRLNTSLQIYEYYDPISTAWVELSGSGTGTVNPGTQYDIAYYPFNGTTLSPITHAANAVLVTNSSDIPSLATTLPTGLSIPGAIITTSTAALLSGQVVAAPTNPTDLANKAYVDAQVAGDVTSITGTANQILVNHPTGAVTLSTPQNLDIHAAFQVDSLQFNTDVGLLDGFGNAILGLNPIAGTANYILVSNNVAGSPPSLSAYGSDPDVSFQFETRGAGQYIFYSASLGASYTFSTGTAFQHATNFIFANTSATRNVTWPDASGTVAFTSGASGIVNPGLINQLAYYAAAGTTLSGLATAASGVLVTSAGSVPSISTTLPNGLAMGTPASLTLTNATGLIPSSGLAATGTPSNTTYLRGDNSWQTISAGGVTSVSGTANRISSTGGATPVIDIDAAYVGQASITTLGTITTGTWHGTVIGSTYGGTGVNNGASTITLAGSLTTVGAFSSTFTMTNTTTVTFPTSGTLATTSQIPTGAALTKTDDTNVTLTLGGSPTTALVNAASLTLGWTGTLSGTRGGTGVNNGASTLTLAGSLATVGAFGVTFNFSNTTNVTFPTSGTLLTSTGAVTSITGTANQIIASASTGAVTLSTPQSLATTAAFQVNTLQLNSTGLLDANGHTILATTGVASAVNYIQLFNNATGSSPVFQANGTDPNVGIVFSTKAASQFVFNSSTLANALIITPGAAGVPVTISATGSDTDVGIYSGARGAGIFYWATTATSTVYQMQTGTAYQHITNFNFANTSATRTVTYPDASGTVAFVGSTVSTLTGTANQVLVNGTSGVATSGAVTLTTPQDIATTSSPTFTAVTAGNLNLATNSLISTNTNGNISLIPNGTGGVLIGSITALGATPAGGAYFQVAKGGGQGTSVVGTYINTVGAANFSLIKSRSTTIGSFVTVQNADGIGSLNFFADDGTSLVNAAGIVSLVTAAVSTGIIPTNLAFKTTTTAGSLTTAMTISNAQIVNLTNALPVDSGGLGITTTPSNGQIPIGNGTNYTAATVTAGSGISIVNASGSITITNTSTGGYAIPFIMARGIY